MTHWTRAPLRAAIFALAAMPAAAEEITAEDFESRYGQQLAQAASNGTLMYRLDRAAWVATDAVLSRDRKARQDRRMRGYIVDDSGGKTRVLFVGLAGETPKALYDVTVENGKAVRRSYRKFPEGRELTAHQAGLYGALETARTVAAREKLPQCGENMNAIIHRREAAAPGEGGYRVWLLSATTKPDVIIAGGHHRIDLNEDGQEVVSIHSFTRTCVNIPHQAGRKKGETLAGLFLTHLKTPYPEEIHVFLSLNHGLPFYVMTTSNRVGWKVDGGKITAEILPDEQGEDGPR